MENQKLNKFKVKFYFVRNNRIVSEEIPAFSSNISDINILRDCIFIEIFTFRGDEPSLKDSNAISVDAYLVGQRFDRARSAIRDDKEKINFVFGKVYKPHTILDEKKIIRGRFVSQPESDDEFSS